MIHDKTTYEIYFYYDDDDDKLWWIQYDDDDSRQVTLNTWHIELNVIDHKRRHKKLWKGGGVSPKSKFPY